MAKDRPGDTALSVVPAEVAIENGDFELDSLRASTRSMMRAWKKGYWDVHAKLQGKPPSDTNVTSISGVNRSSPAFWRKRYPWFDEWVKTPEPKKRARYEDIHSQLMDRLEKQIPTMDPRECIVFLKQVQEVLGPVEKSEGSGISTADVVKAFLETVNSNANS